MTQDKPIQTLSKFLVEATIPDLLAELAARGGIYTQAARALAICYSKTQDYNNAADAADPDATDKLRDIYFPFGHLSYAQMLHTKVQRIASLAQQETAGKKPNNESLQDSYLDCVNYALFGAERCVRDNRKGGQQ